MRQGINGSTFLTVIDEDDEDPFVNVVIDIQEGYVLSAAKGVFEANNR